MIKIALLFLLVFAPAATAQIVDAVPKIKGDTDTRDPIIHIFRPETSVRNSNVSPEKIDFILRLEINDTVTVGRPFRILLRAYDALGLPSAGFNAPVTYESINGVVPIISRAKWLNGLLEDTLIITRPGKNVRLAAIAAGTLSTLHLDVQSLPLTKERWLELAEGHLAEGRFDKAIDAFERASDGHDAAIERKLGRLYLEKGMWVEAELHYLRAVRAATQ